METLADRWPTTILATLTITFSTSVASSTRCTPRRAASAVTATAQPSFHPRALLLGGEDPAHHLARLDQPLGPPELPVAQEARRAVLRRDRVDLGRDAHEPLAPLRQVALAQVHPAGPGPGLDALGRDLLVLLPRHGHRHLAFRSPQQPAVRQQHRDPDRDDLPRA